MSLLVRISLLFIGLSLIVFLIGGVISYQTMKREVDSEQKRFLLERLEHIEKMIAKRSPKDTLARHQFIIVPLAESKPESIAFSDTIVMHSQLNRLEPHLKLSAVQTVNEKSYNISVYGVIVETDDIVDAVTESLVKIYFILLGAILLVAASTSYFALKPFRETLDLIRGFSIREISRPILFPKSSVSEFKKLNGFLQEMTAQVHKDYSILKEFSENASHELQTPIGILQSKLEVLMQGKNLTEDQIVQMSQMQSTIKRMSNLSHSLGLLTKIENKEFDPPKEVNFSKAIEKIIAEFSELVELKNIELSKTLRDNIIIQADPILLELLLTNLINNAIRYNSENGTISISLEHGVFKIRNSGTPLEIDPELLFERFKKSNQSDQSTGLGLAIVKKICELYDFHVGYEQEERYHTIWIKF